MFEEAFLPIIRNSEPYVGSELLMMGRKAARNM
jgi:hypothetical protein